MKITLVVGHFWPHIGGVEKLFLDYAKGILNKGYEVRVVTSNSGGITGKHIYEGVTVYSYPWKIICGHPIPINKDLEEHIKWADIIHTTTFTVANSTRKIAKKYNKPVIITVHEVLGEKWYWIERNYIKAFLFKAYERYVCNKNYDLIHTVSEATKRDYIENYGDKRPIQTIYNAVDNNFTELIKQATLDVNEYFGVSANEKKVLYYGRPGQPKGIFVYLEAIKILKDSYRDIIPNNVKFCFLISDDPIKQKQKFLELKDKYGLQDIITVRSSVKRADLFKCINEADIVVVPSITEGFGFCAAEACELDKPIIHSDGGSLPEVVSGKCMSFRNRDSEDLAKKLSLALTDENAFNNIEKKVFPIEVTINQLIQAYNKLLKNGK